MSTMTLKDIAAKFRLSIRDTAQRIANSDASTAQGYLSATQYGDAELALRVILPWLTQRTPVGAFDPDVLTGARPIHVSVHSAGVHDNFVLVSAMGTPQRGTILLHNSTAFELPSMREVQNEYLTAFATAARAAESTDTLEAQRIDSI